MNSIYSSPNPRKTHAHNWIRPTWKMWLKIQIIIHHLKNQMFVLQNCSTDLRPCRRCGHRHEIGRRVFCEAGKKWVQWNRGKQRKGWWRHGSNHSKNSMPGDNRGMLTFHQRWGIYSGQNPQNEWPEVRCCSVSHPPATDVAPRLNGGLLFHISPVT